MCSLFPLIFFLFDAEFQKYTIFLIVLVLIEYKYACYSELILFRVNDYYSSSWFRKTRLGKFTSLVHLMNGFESKLIILLILTTHIYKLKIIIVLSFRRGHDIFSNVHFCGEFF